MAHNPKFLEIVNDAKSRVKEIDIEGYRRMLKAGEPHLLVDVREDNEWAAGHAAGPVRLSGRIPERRFAERRIPERRDAGQRRVAGRVPRQQRAALQPE